MRFSDPRPRTASQRPSASQAGRPFSGSSAIDANGNVHLIGSTTATNPVTPGAAQTYLGGGTSTFSIPMSIGPEPCSNVLIVKADSCGIEPIPSFEVEAARACSVL